MHEIYEYRKPNDAQATEEHKHRGPAPDVEAVNPLDAVLAQVARDREPDDFAEIHPRSNLTTGLIRTATEGRGLLPYRCDHQRLLFKGDPLKEGGEMQTNINHRSYIFALQNSATYLRVKVERGGEGARGAQPEQRPDCQASGQAVAAENGRRCDDGEDGGRQDGQAEHPFGAYKQRMQTNVK